MSIHRLLDDFLRIGIPMLIGIASIVIAVRSLDQGLPAKLLALAGVFLVASWLILVFVVSPVDVESIHDGQWISWNTGVDFWGYAALRYFQPLAILTMLLAIKISLGKWKPNKSFKERDAWRAPLNSNVK